MSLKIHYLGTVLTIIEKNLFRNMCMWWFLLPKDNHFHVVRCTWKEIPNVWF